jgi:hypothetical protein
VDEPKSLMNLGDLSKPATTLVEKISDAIGGIARPWQIVRVAEAEAEAEKIRAAAQIEISDLQRRAILRFLAEEAKRQNNIESITAKALPDVAQEARPQEIEDDWLSNFFDKCRLISDEEMQTLWARILAGEANSPGAFSKRTINLLSSLDKADAMFFSNLVGFAFRIRREIVPLIYNYSDAIYTRLGIHFDSLKHLMSIGLIHFENFGYRQENLSPTTPFEYFGRRGSIDFLDPTRCELDIGFVILTQTGKELASVCKAQTILGFFDYVFERWNKTGHIAVKLHKERFGIA